jgi:hypothetical protein
MITEHDIRSLGKLREAALKRGVMTRSDRRAIGSLLKRGLPEAAIQGFVDPGQIRIIKAQGKR